MSSSRKSGTITETTGSRAGKGSGGRPTAASRRRPRTTATAAIAFNPAKAASVRTAEAEKSPSTSAGAAKSPARISPAATATTTFARAGSSVRQLSAAGTRTSALRTSAVWRVVTSAAWTSRSGASAIITGPNPGGRRPRTRAKSSGRAVAITVAPPIRLQGRSPWARQNSGPSLSMSLASGASAKRSTVLAPHWSASAAMRSTSLTQPWVRRMSPIRASSRSRSASAFSMLPGSTAFMSMRIWPSGLRVFAPLREDGARAEDRQRRHGAGRGIGRHEAEMRCGGRHGGLDGKRWPEPPSAGLTPG